MSDSCQCNYIDDVRNKDVDVVMIEEKRRRKNECCEYYENNACCFGFEMEHLYVRRILRNR